jgi:hypothetical protein
MSTNHLGGNTLPEITREEHQGEINAKRVSLVSAATIYAVTDTHISLTSIDIEIGAVEIKNSTSDDRVLVTPRGSLVIENYGFSYYQQASLISGYVFHGFSTPGSNPNTAGFKILREDLNFGTVLFANGNVSLTNTWSATSLASISYS